MGFRVEGLGFRAWGLEFRVLGLGEPARESVVRSWFLCSSLAVLSRLRKFRWTQ